MSSGAAEVETSMRPPVAISLAPAATASPSSDVAHQISELTRTMSRFRASVVSATEEGGEWIGNRLLFAIVTHGPMRSGELAELVHADPSTVSRQAAMLVREGVLERRADPNDGRAILLHATEAGRHRHDAHLAVRERYYRQMLDGWSEAEQAQFAQQLRRFIADFDDYEPVLLADIIGSTKRQRGGIDDEPAPEAAEAAEAAVKHAVDDLDPQSSSEHHREDPQ